MKQEQLAIWMSQPNFSFVEIAYACGFRSIVIDIEHGTFDLEGLDRFLAFTKVKGILVLAKVLAPTTEAIQQALDFGADAVILPHLLGVDHAREVTASAKYPPMGIRSYFGGRPVNYSRPTSSFFESENRRVRCFAMVETRESLNEIEQIMALDTVDGLFPGPSDLALARGRGAYQFTDEDRVDLLRCIKAAQAVGKPWVMPAWTPAERAFAIENRAEQLVVSTQFMTIRAGLNSTLQALKDEAIYG